MAGEGEENPTTGVGDPCSAGEDGSLSFNQSLQIASVFIVLVVCLLGVCLPLLERFHSKCRIPMYYIHFGKTMGTGVILSLALIHLLLPGNESLTSECVTSRGSWGNYEAFAYLFCIVGILLMHTSDQLIKHHIRKLMKKEAAVEDVVDHSKEGSPHQNHHASPLLLIRKAGLELKGQAYMLEFALAVHSIFIGIAVGIAPSDQITSLLIALCFHQFFEAIALGSRIFEATELGKKEMILLILIYALSAPIGIMIGIIVETSLSQNQYGFLVVQGVFDSLCAGILLYVGFILLLDDFNDDTAIYFSDKQQSYSTLKVFGLFFALWLGVAIMAFIGFYL